MDGKIPSIALVYGDPFRDSLLRGLGLDPDCCGDMTIEATGGCYAVNLYVWVTEEVWRKASGDV